MGWDWNQAGQGAAGGAMIGGALGPGGAVVGGALGGLVGGAMGNPSDQYRKQLDALSRGFGNRTAPQMGYTNQASYSQFRTNQAGLISQLEAMARGEGPSAAALQMRDAMDRAAATQASAAAGAGGRGVNAGAAFRQSANNTAAIQQQGARDTATLRAQEQLNAIQQLGGVINQGRSADEGMNQFNAGQLNDTSRFNIQAQLQQLGLNDNAQLQALMAALGAAPKPMGTSILAGGASALPSILQYRMAQKNGGAPSSPSAVNSASTMNPFGGPGGTPIPYPNTDFTGTSG